MPLTEAQLDELLNAKDVKPKGTKPEKAMEVAWRYTKEEIAAWRAKHAATTGSSTSASMSSRCPA